MVLFCWESLYIIDRDRLDIEMIEIKPKPLNSFSFRQDGLLIATI